MRQAKKQKAVLQTRGRVQKSRQPSRQSTLALTYGAVSTPHPPTHIIGAIECGGCHPPSRHARLAQSCSLAGWPQSHPGQQSEAACPPHHPACAVAVCRLGNRATEGTPRSHQSGCPHATSSSCTPARAQRALGALVELLKLVELVMTSPGSQGLAS